MKNVGPETKAAIKRIVDNLPHLRSEGSAVPTGARDSLADIKSKYAADHARTDGDPLTFAAQAWVEEQIGEALEKDAHPAKAPKSGTGDEGEGDGAKPAPAKKADDKDADSDTHKPKAKH